ncbi:MAG TPA: helix-turn-helix domain-containing protein [Stellaceae bacterium]|nr:helix-turn-helix domain-containing protein [Stellaceae bacterium]
MPSVSLLPLIDAACRGGAMALLALLAVLLLRQSRRSAAAFYGGLAAAATVAYLVNSWPAVFLRHPPWLFPFMLVSMGNLALLYLWARACFDDDFKRSWRDLVPWLGLVGLGFLGACSDSAVVWRGFQAAQLLFVALIIQQVLRGRAADLVERRRRFRMVLLTAAALYSLMIVLLEMAERSPIFALPVSAANAAGLLAFSFIVLLAEVSLSERGGLLPLPAPTPRRAAPADSLESVPQEAALLARLTRVMEVEKAYREEGLAIAGLAARLDIPEYRLRRLINQRLGHRNFSSFVNGYRLADARAALADPAQEGVPILTIALDSGFQSLGPFNRAFKAETGMTPTDYRRQQLERAQKPAPASPSSEIGKPFPA